MPGATPKEIMSLKLSSCLPKLDATFSLLATNPSHPSNMKHVKIRYEDISNLKLQLCIIDNMLMHKLVRVIKLAICFFI